MAISTATGGVPLHLDLPWYLAKSFPGLRYLPILAWIPAWELRTDLADPRKCLVLLMHDALVVTSHSGTITSSYALSTFSEICWIKSERILAFISNQSGLHGAHSDLFLKLYPNYEKRTATSTNDRRGIVDLAGWDVLAEVEAVRAVPITEPSSVEITVDFASGVLAPTINFHSEKDDGSSSGGTVTTRTFDPTYQAFSVDAGASRSRPLGNGADGPNLGASPVDGDMDDSSNISQSRANSWAPEDRPLSPAPASDAHTLVNFPDFVVETGRTHERLKNSGTASIEKSLVLSLRQLKVPVNTIIVRVTDPVDDGDATRYRVCVSSASSPDVLILHCYRRFNEFYSVFQALAARVTLLNNRAAAAAASPSAAEGNNASFGYAAVSLPPLPVKRIIGRRNPVFVEQRRQSIQAFIDAVVSNTHLLNNRSFLGLIGVSSHIAVMTQFVVGVTLERSKRLDDTRLMCTGDWFWKAGHQVYLKLMDTALFLGDREHKLRPALAVRDLIDVRAASADEIDRHKAPAQLYAETSFVVETLDQQHLFAAASPSTRDDWVSALRRHLDKLRTVDNCELDREDEHLYESAIASSTPAVFTVATGCAAGNEAQVLLNCDISSVVAT